MKSEKESIVTKRVAHREVLQNTFRVGNGTLDASGLSAARNFTLPDATGTLVVGAGLPTGGTTLQVLTKTSDGEYSVAWMDAAGGGGGGGFMPGFSFRQNQDNSPGSGEFMLQQAPDQARIDKRDVDGNDWSGLLNNIQPGGLLEIYDSTDENGRYVIMRIRSVTLSTNTYIFDVSFIEASNEDVSSVMGLSNAVVAFGATGFATTHSITTDNGELCLINDETSPGNNKFYGTDASEGTKAWRTIPLSALGNPSGSPTFDIGSSQSLTFTIASNDALIFDGSASNPTIYLKPMIIYIGDGGNFSSYVSIGATTVRIAGSAYGGTIEICPNNETLKLFGAGTGTGQWSSIADASDEADAVTKLNMLLASLRARGDLAS